MSAADSSAALSAPVAAPAAVDVPVDPPLASATPGATMSSATAPAAVAIVVAPTPIEIVAIVGSARVGSYTGLALRVVADYLRAYPDVRVTVIDPAVYQLPLDCAENHPGALALQAIVAPAAGVLLGTPEYHGSYSSSIKLAIDNLGYPSSLAGKPVALLGVAAGRIGAIKALEHLRSVCSHVGALVLPGPVSLASCTRVFDEQGRCVDPDVDARLRSLAQTLLGYVRHHQVPGDHLEAMSRGGRNATDG